MDLKKHKDDVFSLEILINCDLQIIKKIGNLEIELTSEQNFNEENNYSDWNGYKKLDGKKILKIFNLNRIFFNYIFIYLLKISK